MGDLDSETGRATGAPTTHATDAEPTADAAHLHFETPDWMGPRLGPPTPAFVPAQPRPFHDDLLPEVAKPDGLLDEAHWVEHTRPRLFAGAVLVSAIIGVAITLFFTIALQSPSAMIGLIAAAVIAIIFRGALMSSGTSTIDLKGPILTVHREGASESFNLKDPNQPVDVVGTPDSGSWRLRMTTFDGRVVELTPGQVDPNELMPAVTYYRAVADREVENHRRRFNR